MLRPISVGKYGFREAEVKMISMTRSLAYIAAQMLWRNSSDNLDRNQRNRKIKN